MRVRGLVEGEGLGYWEEDVVVRVCCVVAGIQYLDKVRVWGKTIRVTQSKHSLVQMPKEGQPVSTHITTV